MQILSSARQPCHPADIILYTGLSLSGISLTLPLFYFSNLTHEITGKSSSINTHSSLLARQQRTLWKTSA
jgi:hypothetical protein